VRPHGIAKQTVFEGRKLGFGGRNAWHSESESIERRSQSIQRIVFRFRNSRSSAESFCMSFSTKLVLMGLRRNYSDI
jgi:hypothetical protein